MVIEIAAMTAGNAEIETHKSCPFEINLGY
jgi:hypothetical protein